MESNKKNCKILFSRLIRPFLYDPYKYLLHQQFYVKRMLLNSGDYASAQQNDCIRFIGDRITSIVVSGPQNEFLDYFIFMIASGRVWINEDVFHQNAKWASIYVT